MQTDTELKQAYGRVFKRLRVLQDISQEELAHAIQLERSYISKLENGQYQPKLSTIFLTANYYEITASHLIELVEAELAKKDK